jgi:hypothetical protein
MATITPTPVGGDFNTALFNFLKTPGIEGFEPFVYTDSVGLPTLGVGYLLLEPDPATNLWVPIDLTLLQNTVGLTATQRTNLQDQLQAAANAKNHVPGATNPFPVWYPGLPATANILDWTMTDGQAKTLFNSIIGQYKTAVKIWMGNDTIYNSLQGSKEMEVLVSLAYNGYFGAGKSPMLHKAIVDDGNRADAWYEIRYNTPTTNINRNYAQSALFGLYSNPNEPEARQVYQMYTKHDADSSMYFYDAANGGFASFEQSFQPAANVLIRQYGQGKSFSVYDIRVGESIGGTLSESESTYNMLMIGDAGSDTLIGGSGNDVLDGGGSGDTLQ